MMLIEFSSRGIALQARPDGKIIARGPLTDADRETIRRDRDRLISELRAADRTPHPTAPAGALLGWWETLDGEWQEVFDERAAVREFDGGLTRTHAERATALDLDEARLASGPLAARRFEGHDPQTVLLVIQIEQEIRETLDGPEFAGWSPDRRRAWARSMQGVIKGGGLPVLGVVHAILTDIFQRGV